MSEWISVEDRLPADDGNVLVCVPEFPGAPVWVGFFDRDEWCWADGYPVPGRVTHWQPLPAPPLVAKHLPARQMPSDAQVTGGAHAARSSDERR